MDILILFKPKHGGQTILKKESKRSRHSVRIPSKLLEIEIRLKSSIDKALPKFSLDFGIGTVYVLLKYSGTIPYFSIKLNKFTIKERVQDD